MANTRTSGQIAPISLENFRAGLDAQLLRLNRIQISGLRQVARSQAIAFDGVMGKLTYLGASDRELEQTPLSQWTLQEYRNVYDRWKSDIEKSSKNAPQKSSKGLIRVLVSEAGEIQLAAELIKMGHEAKVLEWIVNHKLKIAVVVAHAASVHVIFGVYVPVVIAAMHYVEVQHVKEQQRILEQDANYLLILT